MASTNKTTNYELSQFQSSDIPAWLTDYNGDMQKIDAGIHAAKVQAEGAASGVTALQSAMSGKQDKLTFDSAPTSGSSNPVTSGGVYDALQNVSVQTDAVPTQGSTKAVQSGGVYTALQGKQNTLTFDSTPTQGSTNPVTSGGVYAALASAGGVTPELLTVTGTASSGGIQGQAVKIGKLVIVSLTGGGVSGASAYIAIPGVHVASAPSMQYLSTVQYDSSWTTPFRSGTNFVQSQSIFYSSSANETRIELTSTTATNTMQFGTLFFICE